MLFALVSFLLLHRLRRDHPELFDGALALAQVNAAIAEYGDG